MSSPRNSAVSHSLAVTVIMPDGVNVECVVDSPKKETQARVVTQDVAVGPDALSNYDRNLARAEKAGRAIAWMTVGASLALVGARLFSRSKPATASEAPPRPAPSIFSGPNR